MYVDKRAHEQVYFVGCHEPSNCRRWHAGIDHRDRLSWPVDAARCRGDTDEASRTQHRLQETQSGWHGP